jgi:hypothetical protein
MGSGITSGVQISQPGVIVREGEIFPFIPLKLLKKTPEQLQATIDHLVLSITACDNSLFQDLERQEELQDRRVVYEFAKTAVERARELNGKS